MEETDGAVGLVAVGVPASTLLAAAIALARPVMMMLMMGGIHGGADGVSPVGLTCPPRL
ncbi:hypothetical protein [Krasilnikovia sp. MM14-A1004]|uniref:hypothetical protein n=1 Tax=Krasilnikovia sp. MM14-A1004 TaxID=3373541 RepID=UPI00399D039B